MNKGITRQLHAVMPEHPGPEKERPCQGERLHKCYQALHWGSNFGESWIVLTYLDMSWHLDLQSRIRGGDQRLKGRCFEKNSTSPSHGRQSDVARTMCFTPTGHSRAQGDAHCPWSACNSATTACTHSLLWRCFVIHGKVSVLRISGRVRESSRGMRFIGRQLRIFHKDFVTLSWETDWIQEFVHFYVPGWGRMCQAEAGHWLGIVCKLTGLWILSLLPIHISSGLILTLCLEQAIVSLLLVQHWQNNRFAWRHRNQQSTWKWSSNVHMLHSSCLAWWWHRYGIEWFAGKSAMFICRSSVCEVAHSEPSCFWLRQLTRRSQMPDVFVFFLHVVQL